MNGTGREGPAMRCRMRFGRRSGAAAGAAGHLGRIKELRALVAGSGLAYYGSRGPAAGQPKMAFGPAGGAGHENLCEYADAWFSRLYREEELRAALSPGTAGLELAALKRVPLLFPSIEASSAAAGFELRFDPVPPDAGSRLREFLASARFMAEREKKSGKVLFDLRPAVVSASWKGSSLSALLRLRAGGRPETLASVLYGAAPAAVLRRELYWEDSSGNFREIL